MRTRRGTIPALITIALLAAACSGAPAATPTGGPSVATSTPIAASASPTPQPDVSAAFRTAYAGIKSGVMAMSGNARIGSQTMTITGSSTFSGSDSQSTTSSTFGGVVTTVQRVSTGGQRFVRNGNGPWLHDAAPPTSDVGAELARMAAVAADRGIETRDGAMVHRLEPPTGTPLDPAALGLGGAGASGVTAKVAFFADDAGHPVAVTMDVAWKQASAAGTIDVTVTLEIGFSQVNVPHLIAPPPDVWTSFQSSRYAFRMAYPNGWDYQKQKGLDFFIAPDGAYAFASREELPAGYSANLVVKSEIASIKTNFKAKTVTNDPIKVAGIDGRLLHATGLSSGEKAVMWEVIVSRGGYIWYIVWIGPQAGSDAQQAVFNQMLGTFAFAS